MADPEVLRDGIPDEVAAHDRAQGIGADTDGVFAVGVTLVLRVEGRDPTHVGGSEVEDLGAEADATPRDIAVDALHEVQQRQQRRPLLRIARDDLFGVGVQVPEGVGVVGRLALFADVQVTGGVRACHLAVHPSHNRVD